MDCLVLLNTEEDSTVKGGGLRGDTSGSAISDESEPSPVRQLATPLSGSESTRLEEDKYIQERVEQMIAKRDTRIGIIAHKFGTAAWKLDTLGSVKWIVSPFDLPARTPEDPPWYPPTQVVPDKNVSVVLVQGCWDLVADVMWTFSSLQVVIAVHPPVKVVIRRRGKRRRLSRNRAKCRTVPQGWIDSASYKIRHNDCGGVSDAAPFVVEV